MASNTAEDRLQECFAVCESFEHFLDQHVWIEDKVNKRAIKLSMWPSQRRVIRDIIAAMLLIILKARQLGLTWITAAYVLWQGIRNPLHLTVVISVNEDLSREFLQRVYFILDRLPPWLVPPVKTRTGETLEFLNADGLVSTVKSLPTTMMGAQSKTPNILVMDETCMNRMAESIFNASVPGIEQAKGQVIIISNSIKHGPGWPWTRDLYIASMRGLNKFRRIFMAWMDHPDRPATFREQMLESGMDPTDFSENYPETEAEAIAAASGSYFGDVLKRHGLEMCIAGLRGNLTRTKDGVEFVEDRRGILEVWRWPYHMTEAWDGLHWTHRYCIGGDVSEGLGQSYSVAYVMDRKTDEIIARMRSNRVDAYTWAEMLWDLARFYSCHDNHKALACIERTGAGQTTVKRLGDLDAPQYVRMVPGRLGSGLTKELGWSESSQAKHELCGDLRQWLRATKSTILDATLLDECSTYIRHENGTLDPEEGKFGDCVVAAGCAVQADRFIGEKPKQIIPGPTGWLKRWQEEGGPSAWAK